MSMRTPEEVAELKAVWDADPYWVLEDTPGFEDHWNELRTHRIACHARHEQDKHAPLRQVNESSQGAKTEVLERGQKDLD